MDVRNTVTYIEQFLYVGKGLFFTLQLLVLSLCLGGVAGFILSFLRFTKRFHRPIAIFVSVIRGTPLILQLSIVFYSIPRLTGWQMDFLSAGLFAFGLNSSAYISEIFRSGLESLPKGQFEAAQTLHIPVFYMWRDIIIPQMIRRVCPALTSEVINLLKETALISSIGGIDIMRRAQLLAASQFTHFLPLCIAALYYYVLVLCIEYGGKIMENRLKNA